MDLPFKKFEKWTIETAQMKHASRKYSMTTVAQSHIRKMSAEYGIEDYQEFLKDLRDVPENYDSLTEPQREFSDLASSVGSWSAICGCVKPYISIDEWLSLDEDTITALGDAVKELKDRKSVV